MKDYYSFLSQKGIEYNPDIVVIAFSFNDIISVDKSNELRNRAENSIPVNTSDRSQKVDQKRLDFKSKYKKKLSSVEKLENSSITRYMKNISEISEERDFDLIFYNIEPIPSEKEKMYRGKLKDRKGNLLTAPNEFEKYERKRYVISRNDGHYNEAGNKWLGKKLDLKISNLTYN